MSLLADLRESICRCCPTRCYVVASGRGACKKLRGDDGRVSSKLLEEHIQSGICPDGHWAKLVTTEGNVHG